MAARPLPIRVQDENEVHMANGRDQPLLGGEDPARVRLGVRRHGADRLMALVRPFERLAIVNRGEAAMRLIHAVRELGAAGERPIRTIALYTDPERGAMFVREADEAHRLGPAIVIDEDGHRRSGYLDFAALESALVATRADAAWVGWGFVAEDPAFAELCERLRIVFVGPDAAVMRLLGDKTEAKLLAEQAGVPVQRLRSPARQVDVQVIADGQGTAWARGVRDCSVQRRNQKVIEESASTALSPEQDRQLRDGAVCLALDARNSGLCATRW